MRQVYLSPRPTALPVRLEMRSWEMSVTPSLLRDLLLKLVRSEALRGLLGNVLDLLKDHLRVLPKTVDKLLFSLKSGALQNVLDSLCNKL